MYNQPRNQHLRNVWNNSHSSDTSYPAKTTFAVWCPKDHFGVLQSTAHYSLVDQGNFTVILI